MKKVLTVLFVLSLVATGLFAGSFKVGAELGWGFDIAKSKAEASMSGFTVKEEMKMKNNGFSANLIGEYDFTKNIGIKASAGIMLAGKAKTEIKSTGTETTTTTADKRSGLWLDFSLGAKFKYPVNEKFTISGLTGLELMYGALYNQEGVTDETLKKMKNLAFGANIGVEVSYMVIDNLDINFGVTGAWFFVNKCESIDESNKYEKEYMESIGGTYKSSKSSFYIRPYVGATYAF